MEKNLIRILIISIGMCFFDSWKLQLAVKVIGYLGGDTRGWSAKLVFIFYNDSTYASIICCNFDEMAHPMDLKLRKLINDQ